VQIKKTNTYFVLVWIIGFIASLLANYNCGNSDTIKPEIGKELAAIYCSKCHLPVDPVMLDSSTWAGDVLPLMARKMGVGVLFNTEYYQKDTGDVIPLESWLKIVKYYKDKAPKQLSQQMSHSPISKDNAFFSVKMPSVTGFENATTTMVAFNPDNKEIYTGNASGKIQAWSAKLEPMFSKQASSAVVAVNFPKKTVGPATGNFTCIGSLSPSDIKTGMLTRITLDAHAADEGPLFTGLPRPVQSVSYDFNNDGFEDWIFCGFGYNEGELCLFEQTKNGGFIKKLLASGSGALQVCVEDFNKDGSPDLMVLFANANERIELMINDGKGNFTRRTLLKFSPLAGSTSFLLKDLNKDGLADLVYTSGDNADVSRIRKPYHGLYIYINLGDFTFKQSYFYPINGCYKVVEADFDKDGDSDLATIAYFPDFKNNPSESFLYFEQTGILSFVPHSPSIEAYGRWTCMGVADIDDDGDSDIILGNYSNGDEPEMKTSDENRILYKRLPFLVLQNNLYQIH
jgi:hypothetical protein